MKLHPILKAKGNNIKKELNKLDISKRDKQLSFKELTKSNNNNNNNNNNNSDLYSYYLFVGNEMNTGEWYETGYGTWYFAAFLDGANCVRYSDNSTPYLAIAQNGGNYGSMPTSPGYYIKAIKVINDLYFIDYLISIDDSDIEIINFLKSVISKYNVKNYVEFVGAVMKEYTNMFPDEDPYGFIDSIGLFPHLYVGFKECTKEEYENLNWYHE